MRWPAVKKTPLLVKYLGCHCGCDVRRFMLWFNSTNGNVPKTEYAGHRLRSPLAEDVNR